MEAEHREDCGGVGEEEDGHLCQGGPYGVNSEGQTADLELEDGEHRRPHLLAHGRGEELPEDVDDEEHCAGAEHRESCGGVDEEEVGHLCALTESTAKSRPLTWMLEDGEDRRPRP